MAEPLSSVKVTERAVSILAASALLAFLYFAREFLLPSVLAALLAMTIFPVVSLLVRLRVPRSLAAMVGTLIIIGLAALIAFVLAQQIASFVQELPGYEDRLQSFWRSISKKYLQLQQSGDSLVPPRPREVKVSPGVPWEKVLFGTAMGALSLAAQAVIAIFVLYFVLAEGANYRRKLIRLFRGEGEDRILTALDQIQREIAHYMLNRVALNAILGVVTALAFALYGLDHAVVWGITTGLLHFIPYLGPALGLAFPVLMAALQYNTWRDPLLVGLIYTGLVGLQGNFVDPIFLGKQLRLNALAIFLGSVFWYWIWGPIGLFLAVPILSVARIVSSRAPRVKWLGEFLAE
jgi:predicted PurR-regulated permease PerM